MVEDPRTEGRILRGIAGFYYTETSDGRIYECRARGLFRKDDIKPLPGDRVKFDITHEGDMEGSITEILPRKNALIRPAVANVDQALLFFSVKEPDPSLVLLDRYLLFLTQYALPAVICFNKSDLADGKQLDGIKRIYSGSGHGLLTVSVKTGSGMDGLRELLSGRTTFLAGPSGAGKSSLINRLCPRAGAETGELSKKLKRGKNTTRHSELFRVSEDDTWIVDTPGFTALELPSMDPESLSEHYDEFAPYRGECRFSSCMHISEPSCAVREAAERGDIPPERYSNYTALVGEMKDRKERRYR